ncbi:unnamed protein product [Arctia plantaginis]|uniref:RNA-binding motif protein 21 n=1 Tax=Arctia plantaginis TaxID=874455 RepID=A0A8S0YVG6_ARCPL|nr:unnamed protein product [Arctia plantaginis]
MQPHNRPIISVSNSINIPVAPRPSNLAADTVNMAPFPPVRPVNSAPESKNANRNQSQNSADPNAGRISSPRRRRRDQHMQNPRTNQNVSQNVQNSQNARTPQNAQTAPPPQEPKVSKVLVTGYPTYTQPHDILEVFTKFGNVRIDKCNSFSATLTYPSEDQALKAIAANKRLHIYGHFLSVRAFTAKPNALEGPMSPKREFPKSKQKSMIIEPDKIDLSGDFYAQLDNLLAAIRLNQEDINKISILYRDLEYAFQVQWPGCKAIPFGSITTGLGIKTSDADCFMSLPLQFRTVNANHVNRARRLLMQHPHIFAEILAIPRANTPIVKFYHVPTDTNCDLTFKTPLGAQNSRLVAFLLNADPRITPMAVVIKYWAKVHELSGTGKLTNYALTWMIIFYLQQPPLSILPSVAMLQRDRANDVIVDCWNTGYTSNADSLPRSSDKSTIAELLGGFFEYYANFNFDEMMVCPYLGTKIKKSVFADTATLPEEFSLYKNNVLSNYVLPLRHQRSFCVQDPFEQCHNVASTITSKLALDIRCYFKFAAAAYKKEKEKNCAGFLKTILVEKPKLLRGKTHPEYRVNLFPRIVNTIISFDWKTVVRNLVKTIFENMMKIKLGKVEEKMNPDSKKDKEKYTCNVTKPIWKRKKYNSLYVDPEMGFEEKQTLISEELIKKEVQEVSLQFQLMLTFCHEPKSAVVTIRMSGGDLDAFREYGKFFISVMQSWFTQLLKPFSMPNCKDTAAKIAEATDDGNVLNDLDSDDEDSEVVLTSSTNRSKEQTTQKKPSANMSECSGADADVPRNGGGEETK